MPVSISSKGYYTCQRVSDLVIKPTIHPVGFVNFYRIYVYALMMIFHRNCCSSGKRNNEIDIKQIEAVSVSR